MKSHGLQLLIIAACLFGQPILASADQIYKCNGKYTNKPCESLEPDKIEAAPAEEKPKPTPTPVVTSAELREKRSILHNLTMKWAALRDKYGMTVDIGSAEALCGKEGPSVDACRDKVIDLSDSIDQKMLEFAKIKAQEDATRAQEQRNKLDSSKGDTNVVVVTQQPVVVHVPVHPPRPGTMGGAGVNIQGSGTGGTVGVGGTVGSRNINNSQTVGGFAAGGTVGTTTIEENVVVPGVGTINKTTVQSGSQIGVDIRQRQK